MSEHKSFAITDFKALGDSDEPGSFEALVGVFGNIDAGGDRIEPGAFKKSLGEWSEKGRNVPVLWSHDIESVPIGVLTHAHEGQDGLHVKAKLFIDDNPQSKAVHAAMKAGALTEFSFGYGARDYSHVMEGGEKVRLLKDIRLDEVSPVFRGMNPETRLTGVKKSVDLDLSGFTIDELKSLGAKVAGVIEKRQDKALSEAEAQPVRAGYTPSADTNVTTELPKDPPDTGTEHEDNPEPNSVSADEEATARIRALLVEHPIHQETP